MSIDRKNLKKILTGAFLIGALLILPFLMAEFAHQIIAQLFWGFAVSTWISILLNGVAYGYTYTKNRYILGKEPSFDQLQHIHDEVDTRRLGMVIFWLSFWDVIIGGSERQDITLDEVRWYMILIGSGSLFFIGHFVGKRLLTIKTKAKIDEYRKQYETNQMREKQLQ